MTRVEPDGQVWAVDTELDNAWGVQRIGAGTVQDSANKGAGVKVAIIDSGIDYTHPDLDCNYVGGYDFVDGDNDPMDVYGHGAHVAGTACAEDNDNGIDDQTGKFGVVGVAPECALYSLRVLNDDGAGSWSDIIAAMEWAVSNDMQVANLSLGSSLNPGGTVKAAFDSAEAAGLVVVPAGHRTRNPGGQMPHFLLLRPDASALGGPYRDWSPGPKDVLFLQCEYLCRVGAGISESESAR